MTHAQDRPLPVVVPDPQRPDITALEPRHPEPPRMSLDPQLPLVLPRYPEVRIPEHRISDSRYTETSNRHLFSSSHSHSVQPYQPTNSNFAILRESRDISTLPISVSHSNYPMITAQDLLASINTTSTMAPSYLPASPPAVLPTSFLYPHLYSSPPQMTNFLMPSGEVRTYEILGQRGSSDIQMRVDRPLSPARLAIEGPPSHRTLLRDDSEERMRIESSRNGVQPMDTHVSDSNRSPPRTADNTNQDATVVWRPY